MWFQNRRAKFRKTSEKNKRKTNSTSSSSSSVQSSDLLTTNDINNINNSNNKINDTQNDLCDISKNKEKHKHIPPSTEELPTKYTVPRLTHPPYTFPTYQNNYCSVSYSNEAEHRSADNYSLINDIDSIKDNYGRNTLINNCENIDWRA